jgi:uncharacterized protein
MKTRRFLVVAILLFASSAPVWADDHAASVEALKNRAAQGSAEAQFNLGVMYHNGQGIPQDYVQALKWFNLAAVTSTKPDLYNLAVQSRDKVAADMTPAQIAEAQKLAGEWKKQ